jgi:hypothetical protein
MNMKKQVALSTLLAIAFVLAPGTSQARWMNPRTERFHTMDTYEGDPQQPLSLHKYLYCQANPVDGLDPSGLLLWLCTRTTENAFPTWAFGRHCYIWDDRTNVLAYLDNPPAGVQKLARSCGQESVWWLEPNRTFNPRDIGPVAGQTNSLPSDTEALPIAGSAGYEDKVMAYARKHINDQTLWWPGNDCHTAVETVLKRFPYLTIPQHDRLNYKDLPQRHFSNPFSGIDFLFRQMVPMEGYP